MTATRSTELYPSAGLTSVVRRRSGTLRRSERREAAPWWQRYVRQVRVTDFAVLTLAVAIAHVIGLRRNGGEVSGAVSVPYVAVSVALIVTWFFAVGWMRTCDRRIIGSGNAEYQRLVSISWRLFTAIGLASFLLQMRTGRYYLAIAFVLGTFLLLVSRWLWRKQLHARRRRGEAMSRVLVVGAPLKAAQLTREFSRNPHEGYAVAGVCVPSPASAHVEAITDAPYLGDFSQAAEVARAHNVDLVAVSGADTITAEAVRNLSWDLEGSGIDVSLTISLVDVAGPRFLLHPSGTLPMVYVDEPEFTGAKFVLKSTVDWLAAALLAVLALPVYLFTALAIKSTSPGPVIYRQTRIGRNGHPFSCLKFRSMYVDADQRLDEVMDGAVSLFYKRQDDPRVTSVGRFIRRFSIDELPQLFNVLRGEMALVGPRPQIDREVALYDRAAERRLLVKPGLTGLWQVSGRSSLSAEDSIRLDVYYVENWTLFGDLLILARTLKAVFGAHGAY